VEPRATSQGRPRSARRPNRETGDRWNRLTMRVGIGVPTTRARELRTIRRWPLLSSFQADSLAEPESRTPRLSGRTYRRTRSSDGDTNQVSRCRRGSFRHNANSGPVRSRYSNRIGGLWATETRDGPDTVDVLETPQSDAAPASRPSDVRASTLASSFAESGVGSGGSRTSSRFLGHAQRSKRGRRATC
jgi:hypothetical protein